MIASSKTSTAIAPMIALNTKADGCNLCKISKPDAIAKPKARFCAVLRPLLECRVSSYVLTHCKSEAQAATVRLRCEAADLIHLREIFGADGVENISRKLLLRPMGERKAKLSQSRGPPVDIRVGKMAAGFGQSDRPGPIPRKIHDRRFRHGQDSGGGVPIPVLAVDDLNATNKLILADFEAVIELEERFGLRYHSIIVTCRPSYRKRAPMWLAPGHAANKVPGIDTPALVKTSRSAGGPV